MCERSQTPHSFNELCAPQMCAPQFVSIGPTHNASNHPLNDQNSLSEHASMHE